MATNVTINQCSICLEKFNQPKLIDCHHSFCLGCLEDYVSKFARNGSFPCPLCRGNNKVPTGGVKDFSSNFYIDQTESVNKVNSVNHDAQKPVELYCKQCFQVVSLKCYVTKHNGHAFLDLEKELKNGSVKKEQTEVSKQLGEKLKTFQDHLEILYLKKRRLDLITNASKVKVKKKVEELCDEIKKRGEDFIADIQDVDDREREKLNEATYEMEGIRDDLRKYVKLLEDSSSVQSLVKVLDTLPKARALLADNCSTDINFPEVGFPIFKTNDKVFDIIGELLGELDTAKMTMFKSSFEFESLKDGNEHYAVDNHDLGKLSVCLMAVKLNEQLGLYLNLNKSDNSMNLMSCTLEYTIKLISFTDSSKSKKNGSSSTYKANAMRWGWQGFIDWDKFVDPENGFIDNNNNFQVEASAICTDLKWKSNCYSVMSF